MTRDDVLRMAREAGFPVLGPTRTDAAVRFVALLTAEACAARVAVQTENEALKERLNRADAERCAAVLAEREACAALVLRHTGIPADAMRRGAGVRDRIVIEGEHIAAAILAYLAIGASLSAVALVRLARHGPSIAHLRQDARDSDLPVWCAALFLAMVMLVVLAEYAVLWPVRWREALR